MNLRNNKSLIFIKKGLILKLIGYACGLFDYSKKNRKRLRKGRRKESEKKQEIITI